MKTFTKAGIIVHLVILLAFYIYIRKNYISKKRIAALKKKYKHKSY